MKKFFKHGISMLLMLFVAASIIPGFAANVKAENDVCPATGGEHSLTYVEAKKPLFTEVGWEAYEYCAYVDCSYTTYKAIPALGEPEINDYESFITNLTILEMIANEYAMANPGNDPLELVIKYIRTGVDRYNSGSWGIMAGYEDKAFADFVRRTENSFNYEIENVDEYLKFTALKNINEFALPNGDWVDFGHMFGTLDISYTNKNSINHADVGGWAGDLVDLISSADEFEVSGTVEEMIGILKDGYFLHKPDAEDTFDLVDFYGDLDAYYIFNTVLGRKYGLDEETGIGTLTQVIMEYFTEDLSVDDRAKYFLKNRLGNVGTREQVRKAVYNEYTGNKVVTTLEATRAFKTTPENINNMRKAACYVFADYICQLAGDYVEIESNPYYSDFNVESSNLAPGVTHETHYATTADGKQIVYYVATADLANENVTVYANYNQNDPTLGWQMSRVLDQAKAAQAKYGDPESEHYIENYQVVASINADGYDMKTGKPGGLLVMNGVEYSGINASGFFGITKEGKAVIGTTAEYNSTYKDILRDGVGAFGVTLVKDGKIAVTPSADYYSNRASRTAVGITKTGKVVFLVLDGRQEPRSCGGSMEEIAQIMLEAGCYTAVNLDGGGSTTFVSKPEGEEELMVTSKPSDGYARSVSTSLMMVSTAPSSTKFDHARLDSDYQYVTVGTPVKITPVALSATGNVVDLPENCEWRIATFAESATITEDGVFTAATNWRDHEIELVCDGAVIGHTTIHVVTPDNVYFERKAMDVVYGSEVDIPVAAVYNGNDVAINENDIILSIDPASVGTFDGYKLTFVESSTVKSATITAALEDGTTSTMSINLYNQGENTFDFDKATSGDRKFAWDRKVSNSYSEDAVSYMALDPNEDMETSYIFAIDMREIPIPTQLQDLLYMLPGADGDGDGMVDADVTAWKFLLQLAERVSVLTEVKPVLRFDERFDIDYSEVEVINDYFYLDKAELDEENNELTLTLKWHDQTASIPLETANPLCMLKGIKLIPKDGAFDGGKLSVVHMGEVGYTIYLRANALYTFSVKPENQEIFGLYDFENTFINKNGEEEYERGGYFNDIYTTFEDRYSLSLTMADGWANVEGGFAYYKDGERFTGVQMADGFYYDFGEDGINVGQTKYTGFFEDAGKTYYAERGTLVKAKWQFVGDSMYHCHADGDTYTTTYTDPITCVKGGVITYKCIQCGETKKSDFKFPEGHDWDPDYKCYACGTVGKDIADATMKFGTVENPRTATTVPKYEQVSGGIRPPTYVSFDNVTALTKSNDATLNSDNTMRDLYVSWTNDRGIGKAYVNYKGKGNYYGEGQLLYNIIPASVTNFRAEADVDSVTLTWNKAAGAGYYRLYKGANGGDWKVIKVTGTSYTITGLEPNTEYTFSIAASAVSTDGEEKVYNCAKWANVTVTTKDQQVTSGLIKEIKAVAGENRSNMLTVDGTKYIMLPGYTNLDEVTLSFIAAPNANAQELSISGDLGNENVAFTTGSNTMTFNLNNVATAENGKYNVTLKVGNAVPMQVVFMQGANVSSMFITSDDMEKDRSYVDEVKGNTATASMSLVDTDGTQIYDGNLTEIKARGNSTFAFYDKKAYQIKLGEKTDLIGCGEKVKTWVLLANYGDATMMHDKFMKDLAIGMGVQYTANSDWVNLWYDGEYRGTYLVSEKVSVGGTSVDITDMEEAYEELNPGYGEDEKSGYGVNKYGQIYKYTKDLTDPDDITGGYLIELNHDQFDEINGFKTKQGVAFNIKSPEYISENAIKYISEYYQEFEDAVFADNGEGYNEETGKYFYEYVDLDSLVKIFTIQEIGLNPDGFISSLYFNKDVNGIMYVGPVWDQDMTLGTGWTKYISPSVKDYHYLAKALIEIPIFKLKLANFFGDEVVAMLEEATSQGGTIDKHYEKLSESAEMNYTLWPYVRVGNPQNAAHIYQNATYNIAVEDMRTWLDTRLGYLKERFLVDVDHEHTCNDWTAGEENHTGICICGEEITEAHVWDDGVVTDEATETEDGVKTFTCEVCDYEKTETIPATGHIHSVSYVDEIPATCTETGTKEHYICRCGMTFADEDALEELTDLIIPVLDHEYGEWEADDDENHKKECVCGEEITEAHEWDEGVVTDEATETEAGVKTYTCDVCGYEKYEEIPATGEPTTGGSTTGGSTTGGSTTGGTTSGGSTTGGSTTGGTTSGGSTTGGNTTGGTTSGGSTTGGSTTGGTTSGGSTTGGSTTGGTTSGGSTTGGSTTGGTTSGGSTTGGTTSGGSTTGGSTTGGTTSGGEETDDPCETGHTWDEGTVTTPATCTETGVKTYTCTVCDETQTEELPIDEDNHTYGDWESNGSTNHKKTCVCGDIKRETHRWNSGVITQRPTTSSTGIRTYTCTVCDETKTSTIPKVSNSSSGGGSSEDSGQKYTVKFNSNGGSTVGSVAVVKDKAVKKPTNPTKKGYTFEGWYSDSKLTKPYNFDSKVTKNITLYAKWTAIPKDEPKEENPKTEDPKTEEPTTVGSFKDVKNDAWFASSVKFAVDKKLMAGVEKDRFAPDMNLTRAMLVTVLYRFEGEPATDKSIPFADVDMSSYYANAVSWAKQNGIVSGVSENEFAPDVNITREQIVSIMHRYAEFKGYDVSHGKDTSLNDYDDDNHVSNWASKSMKYAVGCGLIKGKTDKTLNPKDNATRAEFAAIMQRFVTNNK